MMTDVVDLVHNGRLLTIPNDAVQMNKIDVRNVFMMCHDDCDGVILKTQRSILRYVISNDDGPVDIMSSSDDFELLGAAGLLWVYKDGMYTAMTKHGIVIGEKKFEHLGKPKTSFAFHRSLYVNVGNKVHEITPVGNSINSVEMLEGVFLDMAVSQFGQISTIDESKNLSITRLEDWNHTTTDCSSIGEVDHMSWMGDTLVVSVENKLMQIMGNGSVRSRYSMNDCGDKPVDIQCEDTWGAVVTETDIVVFDIDLSPAYVIRCTASACCVFSGAMFISMGDTVEMIVGTPASAVYCWPQEVEDWSMCLPCDMRMCLRVGSTVIKNELKRAIPEWLSESPSVEGCTSVLPFIRECDELRGAFLDGIRDWVNMNLMYVSERTIWRTIFSITRMCADGGVPASIIEMLKCGSPQLAAIVEFIVAWGAEPLGCRSILKSVLTKAFDPAAREIILALMNSSHKRFVTDSLAMFDVPHKKFCPFDVVGRMDMVDSILGGSAMQWAKQFQLAIAENPVPSLHIQNMFDAALGVVTSSSFMTTDINPSLDFVGMVSYSIDPVQKHLFHNWIENMLTCSIDNIDDEIVQKFVNKLNVAPMAELTFDAQEDGVRMVATNADGVYVAKLFSVEFQKYLGSKTRATIMRSFVTTSLCAWGEYLAVAGHHKSRDSIQYLRIFDTTNNELRHECKFTSRIISMVRFGRILWCLTSANEVFTFDHVCGKVHERLRDPLSGRGSQVVPLPPPPLNDEFVTQRVHSTHVGLMEKHFSKFALWSPFGMSFRKMNISENAKFAVAVDDDTMVFIDDGEMWLRNENNYTVRFDVPDDFMPTAVAVWNQHVLVGNRSGRVYIMKQMHASFEMFFDAKSHITHMHTDGCLLYVSTMRGVHALSVFPGRPMRVLKSLKFACRRSVVWRKAVTNISGLKEFLTSAPPSSDLVSIIDACMDSRWHKHAVAVLVNCAKCNIKTTVVSKLLAEMVENDNTKRFKCVICQSETVNETEECTLSVITTCMHRFHKRCIEELVRKTPEANAEMQEQYALTVDLKCPTCREPFDAKDVKKDIRMTQMCLYDSE